MANAALSNRERKQQRKAAPKPARHARGSAEVRVAVEKPKKEAASDDGLKWLWRKGRLTPAQYYEGLKYRDGFRDAGEVSILTSKLSDQVSGGQAAGLPGAALVSMTAARRVMLVARYVVLRGQVDMLTVMDGVCGAGHTLMALAGGKDHHRAKELEVSLKIALDLLVAYRAGPASVASAAAQT